MALALWWGLAGGAAGFFFWGGDALLPAILLGVLVGWVMSLSARLKRLEQQLARQHTPEGEVAESPASRPVEVAPLSPSPAPRQAMNADVWERTPGTGWEPPLAEPMAELELPDLPSEPVTPPRWQRSLRGFFTDGNLVVRLGLLVLFFGVAFLLKYAADHALLPIELRLSAAALGGIALAGLGWWLRGRRRAFALLLQGGGIGIFYLVVYAATALYGLLPPLLALLLMVVLVGLLVVLALWQDAQGLAVFAITGGFLAPVLASSGAGNHVLLFSYYALLNVVILVLAWFRTWRPLNLLGFLFTFVIGTLWGVLQYHPQHYATTQPFLIFFFLLYVSVAVLFALRQPLRLRGYVDAGLVFGVPIVAFGLQAALVHRIEYGMAFSALVLGGFYLVLARVLWQRQLEGMRLFCEALLALGVIFLTLAIPLALEARWTATAWALEGAAMLWIGWRQQRLMVRLFGLGLQLCAGVALLLGVGAPADAQPLLNGTALGGVLVALAGLFSAWVMQREPLRLRQAERLLHGWLLGWGLLWWLGTGLAEIDRYLSAAHYFAAALMLVALTTLAALWLWRRLPWPVLRWPLLGSLGLIWLMTLSGGDGGRWLQGLGLLAWPLALVVQYRLLWRLQGAVDGALMRLAHAATLWLVLLLLCHDAWAWSSGWLGRESAWAWAALALPGLLALALLPAIAPRLRLGAWAAGYQGEALAPVAVLLSVWLLWASSHPASAAPLPWLPILNPLELTQALTLLAMALWLNHAASRAFWARLEVAPQALWSIWGALAFVLLNTMLAHAVHHWAGVAWQASELFASARLQASLSVAWTLTALGLGWWATRRQARGVWFVAAGLIALVVLKLFVIDLADSGTIERIVSFIAVGLLMLLMGYVAPLPPRAGGEDTPSVASAPVAAEK